jgi:hypothetical protein
MPTRFWWVNLKQRGCFEDSGVDVTVILNCILINKPNGREQTTLI